VTLGLALAGCAGGAVAEQNNDSVEPETITIGSPPRDVLARTRVAIEANRATEKQLNLVSRVILDDGNAVEFYEPAPGHVIGSVISVGGRPITERVPDFHSLPATKVFEALAPGVALPARLAAAQAHVDARLMQSSATTTAKSARTESAITSIPIAIAPTTPTFSQGAGRTPSPPRTITPLDRNTNCANWCDTACWETWGCGSGDSTWCFADAWDGAYAHGNGNFNDAWADVCAVNGTPQFHLASDSYGGSWAVPPQTDRSVWTSHCGLISLVIICGDQSIDYWVDGNGGDYFHFGGYFNDQDP
jgi:hypothetical protein